MGTFDYDSFADLSCVFDLKKGAVVPPIPKARVILFASTALLPQSRFANLRSFLPMAKPRFLAAAAKAVVEAVVAVPAAQPQPPTPKVRGTLRLKTKVELPQVISRYSTTQELATAFKAGLGAVAKKKKLADYSLPDDVFEDKKRRHPLSNKSWTELLAEAEAMMVQKPKKDFDLGAAFKAEMKAFEAEQRKLAEAEVAAVPVASTPAARRASFKLVA